MSKKHKRTLGRIAASAVVLAAAWCAPQDRAFSLAAYIVSYGIIGWDVLWRAARNICHGQVFDENFLMTLATVGAFLTGEFREAVAVMLFYQVGNCSRAMPLAAREKSIAALMDIRPDSANIERDGALVKVDPEEVAIGDVIVVKAGERIPSTAWCWRGNLPLIRRR